MTSKERVIKTLNFQEPDIVPWGEHSIDYNIYEMILGRPSYLHAKFKETQAYWEGKRDEVVESYKRDYVDLALALDMDILTVTQVPHKGYAPQPLKKIDDETYGDDYGNIFKYSPITNDLFQWPLNTAYFRHDVTMDEIEKLVDDAKALPPLDPNPNVDEYEVINHVVEKLGKTHFIIAPVNGIEWARFGVTEEDSWMNLLTDPEICAKIAEFQYIHTIRELDRLAATGIDGVLSVGDLGNTTNLYASPDLYREITLPYHKKIYEHCKKLGLYVMRHCCGHVWPIINEIAEYNDAYEAIQEYAGMDICRLKNEVGNKLCLWGGVKHENIHGGTPEDIREDIKRSFACGAKGGGFIMGSSHSLTIGATYDNIMAMKKYREQYGVSPIK